MKNRKEPKDTLPTYLKFVFSGISGVGAVCCTHPMDFLKNRMQIEKFRSQHVSTKRTVSSILNKEGVLAMYSGLSAGILRQSIYTTSRLGIYSWLLEIRTKDGVQPVFIEKIAVGLMAGGIASMIATPTDVALVRMTLHPQLYRNVFNALYNIVKTESVFTLWRGCWPTVLRAMVGNATQLATYSQMKHFLIKTGYFDESFKCHLVSSIASGLATAISILPLDIAKTRIQDMKNVNPNKHDHHVRHVWKSLIRKEGFLSLWKGFTPYLFRSIPHGVLVFVLFEQLNVLYFKYVLKVDQASGIL